MRMVRRRWVLWILLVPLGSGFLSVAAETDMEKAARLAGRYEQMVLRRPRLGPSLEKLIQLQGEAGQFEAWMEGLSQGEDGGAEAAFLHGLVLYQQGQHKDALGSFERSLKAEPDQWYAQFLRGRLLLLDKEYEGAVESYIAAEKLTEREEDLVEVLKELGRAQVRVDRLDDARLTWDRLIEINAKDEITLEELADTLADEGVYEEAVALIERLRDREGQSAYNQMRYRLRRASLLARMGQEAQALAAWREVLTKVEESSWFYREALGRIEAQFQRSRNTDGLAAFYKSYVEEKSDALGVRMAWARLLESRDKMDEAIALLEETRQRAPRNGEVQQRLAELMAASGRFADAVELYEGLHRQDARDPEPPRALGALYAGRMTEDAGAKAEVLRWFGIMADVDPASTPYALQAAEALIRYGMAEEAVAFFDRAIDRSPFALDTYRAKAELLLQLERKADALEAFAAMVAGKRRSVVTLMQQAEALAANDLFKEALVAAREAVVLEPEAFDPAFFLLGRLREAEDWEAVQQAAAELVERAPNAYFKDQVIDLEITAMDRLGTLPEMYQQASAATNPDSDACLRLARMALVLDRPPATRTWVEKALEVEPTAYRMEVATRIYRKLGLPWAQIELLERLVELAPAMQTETARRLVSLYERVGEPQKAMESARRVVRSLPGNRDAVELLAQLLRRQGRSADAIIALERAARSNDDDLQLLARLADLYRQQRQKEKAVSAYWTLFQRTEDGQARLRYIKPLFELYREGQGSDALVQRLKEVTRSERDPSLRPLAMAYVWELDGRTDLARGELEKVLVLGGKDLRAMKRLVGLAKVDGNLEDAIRYQQDVVEAEPTAVNTRTLGDLFYENGEEERAQNTWREVVERVVVTPQNESARYFDWVNTLITKGLIDQAVEAVKDIEPRFRDDWSVSYRVARAFAILDKPENATRVFLRLMNWKDDLSVDAAADATWAPSPFAGMVINRNVPTTGRRTYLPGLTWSFGAGDLPAGFGAAGTLETIRSKIIQPGGRYGAYQSWRPRDVNELKVASLVFLLRLSEAVPEARAWVAQLTPPDSPHPLRMELAYLQKDMGWFDRGLAAEQEAFEGASRLVWMALALRLQELRSRPTEQGVEAFEILVSMLEKRLPEEGALMDVLRWQAVVYQKNSEGEEALVQRMLAQTSADAPSLYSLLSQLIQLGHRDKALAQVRTFVSAYQAEESSAGDANVLMRINHIQTLVARQNEYALLVELFDVYMTHQRAVTRRIIDGDLMRPNFMQVASQGRYPGPNTWFDTTSVQVVRQLQAVARRAGELESLMKRLEDRLPEAGMQRIQGASILGLLAYGNSDKKTSATWLGVATEAAEYDPELVRQLVGLLRQEGDAAGALALLGRVKPGPGFSPKEYYQLRYNLGLISDNTEAAKAAGLRLIHMTLTSTEMVNLADRLRDWGMNDEAARLEDRASRQSSARLGMSTGSFGGGNLQQEVQLMERSYREGHKERAVTMAVRLLDAGLDLEGYERANYVRERTLRLLNQSPGGMDAYITRGKERLEKSPQSITLLKRMALGYHLAGDTVKGLEHADRLAEMRTSDMRHQATMGVLYSLLGEWGKGLARLDLVLERKPSLVFSNRNYLNALRSVTRREGKGKELAERLTAIGYTRLGNTTSTMSRYGSGSSMVLNELMQFARLTANESGAMPEVALAIADLAENGVPSQLKSSYGAQFSQIRLIALKKLGRTEEIMTVYAATILDQSVLDALGIETQAVNVVGGLRNVTRKGGVVSTGLDEFVAAAKQGDLLVSMLDEFDRRETVGTLSTWEEVVRLVARLEIVADTNDVTRVERVKKDLAVVANQESSPWKMTRQSNKMGRVTPDVGSAIMESIGRRLEGLGLAEEAIPVLRKGFMERVAVQPYYRDTRMVEQLLKLFAKTGKTDEAVAFLTNDYVRVSLSDIPTNYPKEQMDRQRLERLGFVIGKLVSMEAYDACFTVTRTVLDETVVADNDHYMRRVRDALKAFASRLEKVKKDEPEQFKAFINQVRPWSTQNLHPELARWLARLLAVSGETGSAGELTRVLFNDAKGNLGVQLGLVEALAKQADKKTAANFYEELLREHPEKLKGFQSATANLLECFFERDRHLKGLQAVLGEAKIIEASLQKALDVNEKSRHLNVWMSLIERGSRKERGGKAFGLALLAQIPETQLQGKAFAGLASRVSAAQLDWVTRELATETPDQKLLAVTGLPEEWAQRVGVAVPGLTKGSVFSMSTQEGEAVPVVSAWMAGEHRAGRLAKSAALFEAEAAKDGMAAWLHVLAKIASGDVGSLTKKDLARCSLDGKTISALQTGGSITLTVNGQNITSNGGSVQVVSGGAGVFQTRVRRSSRGRPPSTGLVNYVVQRLVEEEKEVLSVSLLGLLDSALSSKQSVTVPAALQKAALKTWSAERRAAWLTFLQGAGDSWSQEALLVEAMLAQGQGKKMLSERPEIDDAWVYLFKNQTFEGEGSRMVQVLGTDLSRWPAVSSQLTDTRPLVDGLFAKTAEARARDLAVVGPWLVSQVGRTDPKGEATKGDPIYRVLEPIVDHCADSGLVLPVTVRKKMAVALAGAEKTAAVVGGLDRVKVATLLARLAPTEEGGAIWAQWALPASLAKALGVPNAKNKEEWGFWGVGTSPDQWRIDLPVVRWLRAQDAATLASWRGLLEKVGENEEAVGLAILIDWVRGDEVSALAGMKSFSRKAVLAKEQSMQEGYSSYHRGYLYAAIIQEALRAEKPPHAEILHLSNELKKHASLQSWANMLGQWKSYLERVSGGSLGRWKRAAQMVPQIGGGSDRDARDVRMISWFDAQGEMDLLQHATAGAAQRVHQSISTNHPPLQWVATRVEGGLQADGKRTDWKDVSFQAMTQEVGNATASSNRCTVAFAESEGLLWVAWEVTDADIVGAATIGRWDTQQCDSMALLLTPENEAARGRLTPGPASLRFEMVLPSENETNPLARCPVPGARVGWHREGDRVFLELALPMDELARVAGYRGKEWRVESVWQDRDRTGQVKWHSATGRRADIHVPARATLRWGGEATP